MSATALRGFTIENEWFWRINEGAQTFDATAALRDFLTPLARLAKGTLAITELVADGGELRFLLAGEAVALSIVAGATDRIAISHFVSDLNRALGSTHHQFGLIVPRRYELRGVLLTDDEMNQLAGDPMLLVPSGRPSSRSMPAV